ncbi:MAG: C4-type zinc ribbon domain-containing protein [candidate division WOR-3 bacterium]
MLEVLNLLTVLQQIDNELATLAFKNQEIPKKIEGLKLAVKSVKDELDNEKHHLQELKKKYKLAELELKSIEEKIAQYSVQLYQAKTNEQYKAFLKEIENQKLAKNQVEDRMLEDLELTETTEKKIATLTKELAEIETETQAKIWALEKDAQNIQTAIQAREDERKKVCENLAKDILNVYERIRKSKGGLAVVVVKNEKCSGCLNPIPPQVILEIRKSERLYFCDYCGRILTYPIP